MLKLQEGTTQALFYSQKTNPLFVKPVLQITNLSKFSTGPPTKDRYKANLSDGQFYLKTVFSSELCDLFESGRVSLYSLVKLDVFSIRSKENNNYLYVQSFSEYESGDSEIGRSVNIYNGKQSLDASNPTKKSPEQVVEKVTEKRPGVQSSTISQMAKRVKADDDDEEITEIQKIFPHKKNMTVVGRVVSKSDIKKFTTQKGEGKVFSFELADKTGQIKCVAFSENVDIFYPLIENNAVYSISNGTVKLSNKKFSNATSDFEIHLERNSEIKKIEDSSIPKYMFNFIKISDLSICTNLVDIIGVVKEASPSIKVPIKSTGKETEKRDLVIVDQTGAVRFTIWGPRAEEEVEKDTVIVLKSVRVGEYNGVTISTVQNSQILFNLDIQESVELASWYQENGKDVIIEKPKRKDRIVNISAVKDYNMEYATIRASILYMKEDSIYYESCPSESCNKKVTMEDNGTYRCERCNYTYDKCDYRFMTNIHVGDFTGQLWITVFDSTGVALFGMTAKELKEMGETNPENVHNLVQGLVSKEFTFKVRSKQENYNGEMKLRSNSMEIGQIDYVAESNRMLDAIDAVSI